MKLSETLIDFGRFIEILLGRLALTNFQLIEQGGIGSISSRLLKYMGSKRWMLNIMDWAPSLRQCSKCKAFLQISLRSGRPITCSEDAQNPVCSF